MHSIVIGLLILWFLIILPPLSRLFPHSNGINNSVLNLCLTLKSTIIHLRKHISICWPITNSYPQQLLANIFHPIREAADSNSESKQQQRHRLPSTSANSAVVDGGHVKCKLAVIGRVYEFAMATWVSTMHSILIWNWLGKLVKLALSPLNLVRSFRTHAPSLNLISSLYLHPLNRPAPTRLILIIK